MGSIWPIDVKKFQIFFKNVKNVKKRGKNFKKRFKTLIKNVNLNLFYFLPKT